MPPRWTAVRLVRERLGGGLDCGRRPRGRTGTRSFPFPHEPGRPSAGIAVALAATVLSDPESARPAALYVPDAARAHTPGVDGGSAAGVAGLVVSCGSDRAADGETCLALVLALAGVRNAAGLIFHYLKISMCRMCL